MSAANCTRLICADEDVGSIISRERRQKKYRNDEYENMCGVRKNAEAMRVVDLHYKTDWIQ